MQGAMSTSPGQANANPTVPCPAITSGSEEGDKKVLP